MSFTLDPIPLEDLTVLATSAIPAALAGSTARGAHPPAFVAIRSLAQLASGKPARWCSTFYIRDAKRQIVGSCGFKDEPAHGRIEIGYAVSPARRNRGIATSAVQSLIALAFESSEVSEVRAQVSEHNLASTRVVEKLGFARNGVEIDHDNEALVQWILRAPTSRSDVHGLA